MLRIVYSGFYGLSIICDESQAIMKIVDDDLKVYKELNYDDAFYEPIDSIKAFVKATVDYFKDCRFPQFKQKALEDFSKSDFIKDAAKYQKENY